jgi:hypothetical protein
MGNSLRAFITIVNAPLATINPAKISSNRINNVGDALEGFIKDVYSGALSSNLPDTAKDLLYAKTFSWLGNSSHAPDCMIRGGDAIEVKKISNLTSSIALNSSHPKNKLHSDDPRVASGAKAAEPWTEKDIVYAIGSTANSELKRLWLIYGDCFAASREVYERVVDPISRASRAVYTELGFDLEVATNEIAKFNKVDPSGITDLRVRGMWSIKNPSVVFADQVHATPQRQYYLLMREEKYMSFSEQDRSSLEAITIAGFSNTTISIKNPDNPAQTIQARLISYEI